jgi:two-component system LytT family response regulator
MTIPARRIKAIIADDEPLSLRRVEAALEKHPEIEIAGVATNGLAALDLIRQHQPDLVLLDIQMPGIGGIEIVEALRDSPPPAIIFVTAFNDFAVEAFGVNAVDYLVKPLDEERLDQALERVRSDIENRSALERATELGQLVQALRADQQAQDARYTRHLWVAVRERVVRIPAKDIIWVEAAGDYVIIHTADRDYMMPDSLRALGERLDPSSFLRIHRGSIVNRSAIQEVIRLRFGRAMLQLSTGAVLNVGRNFRHQLERILTETD